ncbi:Peptide-N4-(N-acetyl-beta-glucosaminyl)asparagine amidase A [Sphaceloma murrayae]|uniref:Peptide-N4-(N-acetyl-beta-glucosaminyl)asparagine amidase A n=1 Tax=Sphaceloma murrayae TaxID=2082308 RepID=A0A2K1QVE0_9PEZI|nr:Peptide-N4-(N-acetyl-beta-glucosaminyl)asparagine amidase A [Sphaceloma murrayae]
MDAVKLRRGSMGSVSTDQTHSPEDALNELEQGIANPRISYRQERSAQSSMAGSKRRGEESAAPRSKRMRTSTIGTSPETEETPSPPSLSNKFSHAHRGQDHTTNVPNTFQVEQSPDKDHVLRALYRLLDRGARWPHASRDFQTRAQGVLKAIERLVDRGELIRKTFGDENVHSFYRLVFQTCEQTAFLMHHAKCETDWSTNIVVHFYNSFYCGLLADDSDKTAAGISATKTFARPASTKRYADHHAEVDHTDTYEDLYWDLAVKQVRAIHDPILLHLENCEAYGGQLVVRGNVAARVKEAFALAQDMQKAWKKSKDHHLKATETARLAYKRKAVQEKEKHQDTIAKLKDQVEELQTTIIGLKHNISSEVKMQSRMQEEHQSELDNKRNELDWERSKHSQALADKDSEWQKKLDQVQGEADDDVLHADKYREDAELEVRRLKSYCVNKQNLINELKMQKDHQARTSSDASNLLEARRTRLDARETALAERERRLAEREARLGRGKTEGAIDSREAATRTTSFDTEERAHDPSHGSARTQLDSRESEGEAGPQSTSYQIVSCTGDMQACQSITDTKEPEFDATTSVDQAIEPPAAAAPSPLPDDAAGSIGLTVVDTDSQNHNGTVLRDKDTAVEPTDSSTGAEHSGNDGDSVARAENGTHTPDTCRDGVAVPGSPTGIEQGIAAPALTANPSSQPAMAAPNIHDTEIADETMSYG